MSSASTVEGRDSAPIPNYSSLPTNEISMKPVDKVTPKIVLLAFLNPVAYPRVREGVDIPLGFKGQSNTKGNFSHTLFESDEK